jgi:hypothetical protein
MFAPHNSNQINNDLDYLDKIPEAWKEHGGVFLPMWQREAMYIRFIGNLQKE